MSAVRRAAATVGFWTLLGLAFSLPAYFFFAPKGDPDRVLHALRAALPQWYAWGLVFPALRLLDRRLLGGRPLPLRLAAHVPLSLVITTAWLAVRAGLERLLGKPLPTVTGEWLAGQLAWNLPTYWLIFGLWAARHYHDDGQRRALRNAELQRRLAQTRLDALRAQLQPHFLFNALNAVSALMERDVGVARRVLSDLGDLLRLSLDRAESPETPLADEIRFVQKYLDIQGTRFGDRMRALTDVPPDLWTARVPTLILQPLVENAIVHGITARVTGGTVVLRARRIGQDLRLDVEDDGCGLPPGWSLADARGVGLRNVRERLEQLFPGRHAFTVAGRPGGGVIATVQLPLRGDPA